MKAALVLPMGFIQMVTAFCRDLQPERLMGSGQVVDWSHPGKQHIKKEWDLIEAWLKANIKDTE
jgi:hypothetical protein